MLRDSTECNRAVREAGPVVHAQQTNVFDLVTVSCYATVKALFDNPAMFVNSRGGGILDLKHDEKFREPGLLQENDPPSHTAIKAVMTSVISPRELHKTRRQFQAAADNLMDKLTRMRTFGAQTAFARSFTLKVIPDAITGVRDEGSENLLRYSNPLFESMGTKPLG